MQRVAREVENLVFHHSEITILYAESSVEKFVFYSSAKLSEFVKDMACHASAPYCTTQVLPKFHEVLSAVFACM